MPEDILYLSFGDGVKTSQDGMVEGYLVKYGKVDVQREYFDKDTDYGEATRLPLMYHHGLNKKMGKQRIGYGDLYYDDVGIFIKGQLDLRKKYVEGIHRMAMMGELGWSSGSAAHAVEKEPQGRKAKIKQWFLAEASLTPTPAEISNQVLSIKSYVKSYSTNGEPSLKSGNSVHAGFYDIDSNFIGDTDMTTELDDAIKAALDKRDAEAKAEQERQEVIKAEAKKIAQAEIDAFKAELARERRLPDGAPVVRKFNSLDSFRHVPASDLAVALGVLQANKTKPSENAFKALALKIEDEYKEDEVSNEALDAMKTAGIKADEMDYSTLSSYGDEWVGVAYSAAIWQSIRQENRVLGKLPSMEMPKGVESMVMPLESTDPIWYKVAETTSSNTAQAAPVPTVTASPFGTGQKSISVAKLGARVIWSGELDEVSIVPFASQLRSQLALSGADYLESLIIDGDTAAGASANINDIAGTPAATDYFLLFNGLRKSPLVTTAANSRSALGSLDIEDFLETIKLMGNAGMNAMDTSKVGFIIDPNVMWKAMTLPEVLTRDSYASPTIEGGKLKGLFGYEIYTSPNMCKASATRKSNVAGKVDVDTPGNNLYGSILSVRYDQWKFAWGRHMTMETTRFANSDSTEIVAMLRCGLAQRDTEASAITYYVGV